MIGETGEALTNLEPEGQIRVHGEVWNAESLEGSVNKGEKVKVDRVSNLKLMIRKTK